MLAAHGLSAGEATVDDVLAIDGLADAVVDAAAEAVGRVGFVGFRPDDLVGSTAAAGSCPAGWEIEAPRRRDGVRELAVEHAALAVGSVGVPAGWALHVDVGPRHLMSTEDGEPCYPDIPAFADAWPKCPPPDPPPEDVPDVPCLEDSRFVDAEARLRELRSFSRVPDSFRGFDYRARLEDSVSLPLDDLYRCGANPSTPNTMASWHGPPGPERVLIHDRFLDLAVDWDLVSLLTGPVDFRAAILLHEHVHRIEDPQMGTVSAPPDRDYHPVGSAGQEDCPLSGTEYDAAYIQTLFLGADEATARMTADIYGRKQCGQLSRSAQLLAAAGDIIEVLALGWLAGIEVIATLTARLIGEAAVELLSSWRRRERASRPSCVANSGGPRPIDANPRGASCR